MKPPCFIVRIGSLFLLLSTLFQSTLRGQNSAFNYQGRLHYNADAANGIYDLQFTIYDVATGGTAIAGPLTAPAVAVSNGLVTVRLDFGAAIFNGDGRWLEIAVRPTGSPIGYQPLSPRQSMMVTPYAIRAARATLADSAQAANGAVPWYVVAGNSQLAQANSAYLATNQGETIISLPNSANVGDIIRVSACEPASWSLPSVQLGPAGEIWVAHQTNRPWVALASSADGSRLVAAAVNFDMGIPGSLYVSTDTGVTWTARESERFWSAITSSADGTRLVATVFDGRIYTSTDGGTNWTARETDRLWKAVASSVDGTRLVAVVGGGRIYTSTDSGTNWTPRELERGWQSVASSADGMRLVAGVGYGALYVSTDGGVSWTPRDADRDWRGIASSADGHRLVALEWNAISGGGQIYVSSDGGTNWTAREEYRAWWAVASSADGSRLVAVVGGDFHETGQVYVSTDGGENWSPHEGDRNWYAVASSADGKRLAAAVNGGRIFTSSATSLSGGPGSSVELQYTGNGEWIAMNQILRPPVGIGTITPQFTLHVNGTAGKPGGGLWSSTSDERLKKHIQPLAGALERLLALRGVSFEYIDPKSIHELSGERMGLIAQEVEKVFPDWVETGPDGYKRVTVRGLEALVVEALRQLRQEKDAAITDLQHRNASLEQRIENLEQRLGSRQLNEPERK